MPTTYDPTTKKFYRDDKEWDPGSEGFTVDKKELEKYTGPSRPIANIGGVKSGNLVESPIPDFINDLRFSSPKLYEHVVKPLTQNLGATGAMLGMLTGNPLITAGGGIAGNLLSLAYNKYVNRDPSPINTEQTLEVGAQGLLDSTLTGGGDYAAKVLSSKLGPKLAGSYTPGIIGSESGLSIKDRLAAWMVNKSRKSTAEDVASIYDSSPNGVPYVDRMQYSAGDLSQSPLVEWGEKGFQGSALAERKRFQEDMTGRMVNEMRGNIIRGNGPVSRYPVEVGPQSQEAYGGAIQAGIKAGYKDIKGQQTLAWDTIQANLDRSKTQHQIVTKFETKEFKDPASGAVIKVTAPAKDGIETREYRGLIPTTETQSKLEEFAPMIEKIFSDDAIQSLPTESLKTKYKLVKQMLDNITKSVKESDGEQIKDLVGKEFEQLKNARTGLNNIYYRSQKIGRTNDERMLKEVTNAMSEDLDNGAEYLGISEPWARANKLRVEQQKMFPENVLQNVYRNRSQEAYSQDIVPKNIGHAEKTREIYRTLPDENKQYFRGGAFEHLMKESTTPEGNLDVVKFNSLINDIDSGYRVVFTPEERKQFTTFAKAVGLTSRQGSTVGLSALNYRRGYIALNLVTGLGTTAATGEPSYGLAAAATSGVALISIKNFSKALLKPSVARTAIELAKLDPSTGKAKLMSKALLHSLRGARVMFGTGDAFYPALISEDGRIQPEQE